MRLVKLYNEELSDLYCLPNIVRLVKLYIEELSDLYCLPNIVRLVKLCNEELSDLYFLPDIVRVVKSRRMRWAGNVARTGQGRRVFGVLVWKPEGKRPLWRPRRRWEDNIKRDLQEV